MRIGYERLFNMGNYEHEKFIVSKEAESEKEILQLVKEVARLEMDIQRFRKARSKLESVNHDLQWRTGNDLKVHKPKLEKEKKKLEKIISDFKNKHNPELKPCKCAFCMGEWENDEWDYI